MNLNTEAGAALSLAVRRQAKELRVKLLHAPQAQRGPLGEVGGQVVVGNHHHLHPCS